MKRDMDLVRDLLLKVEADQLDDGYLKVADERIGYHLELLIQQRWLDGVKVMPRSGGGYSYGLFRPRLTWGGNEFLDSVRAQTVWEQVKKFVSDKGVGLTFDAIKVAAPIVANQLLNSK